MMWLLILLSWTVIFIVGALICDFIAARKDRDECFVCGCKGTIDGRVIPGAYTWCDPCFQEVLDASDPDEDWSFSNVLLVK